MAVPTTTLRHLYEMMLRERIFEERILSLIPTGRLPAHYHLAIGEEATFQGAMAALGPTDWVMTTYRGFGAAIGKGIPFERIAGDCFLTLAGTTKGKGGHVRVVDPARGLLGFSGVLGGEFAVIMGAALSSTLRRDGRVAMAIFGDGTANRGTFHEAVNMAALWRLPAIYLCHNNQYAIATSMARSTSVPNIADRAAAYGIPGVIVDGNDVETVYEAVAEARRRGLAGEGPTLIEAKTYRFRGHFEGLPEWRPLDEVEAWKRRDPVVLTRQRLMAAGALGEGEDAEIQAVIAHEVDRAIEAGESAPKPAPESALDDVYA